MRRKRSRCRPSWVLEDPFYRVSCMLYVHVAHRMLCTGWWRASRGRCVVCKGASAARARDRRGGGGRSRHDALTAGPSEQPTDARQALEQPTQCVALRCVCRPDRSPPVCPPGSALDCARRPVAAQLWLLDHARGAVAQSAVARAEWLHCTALHCTALQRGERTELGSVGLFADGAAVKFVGRETFRVCHELVDEMITERGRPRVPRVPQVLRGRDSQSSASMVCAVLRHTGV